MLKWISGLNWWAVLVATVAYYVLGGLWFSSPLFGHLYHKALGFRPPQGWTPGSAAYFAPLAGCLAASVATAILARATNSKTVVDGLALGLVVSLGYAAAVAGMAAAAPVNAMPGVLFAVLGAYHVVGLAVVSTIVSVWPKRSSP